MPILRKLGWNGNLFTAHSTRVAGVCYLLRAGLPETVISVLDNWTSNQIQRYANRLALGPGLMSPSLFFNPLPLAMYAGSSAPPLAKHRRVA